MPHRGGRRGGTWVDRPASRATGRSASERGRRLNYARRQQYRRLSRAGKAAAGSVVAVLLALVFAGAGATPLAGLLLVTAFGLGLYARHWFSLARRSRVGARSEDEVQRALPPRGGELAPSALLDLAWPGRHRLGGNRSHRRRDCDRDQNADVRRSSPRSSARAGGMAGGMPAKVGTSRRPWRHVPGPRARRRARRA
jgi:hypothetical protein